mmetsp:Transcript_118452/g.340142  ORF Transcript_118452/g.340142 Transcript_118452/m.340142 type:complete len:262 (+) Transcript_118452:455-1240(+)
MRQAQLSGVQELEQGKERFVRDILDNDLWLEGLPHAASKRSPEVVRKEREDDPVGEQPAALNSEGHVRELFLVQILAHDHPHGLVAQVRRGRLHRRWSIGVQDEPLALAVVLRAARTATDEKSPIHNNRDMPCPALRRRARTVRNVHAQEPGLLFRVVDMHIVEAPRGVARPSEEVQAITDDRQRHARSRLRRTPAGLEQRPTHVSGVENIQVVQALGAVPTTEDIEPEVVHRRGVVRTRWRLLPARPDRIPTIRVQVQPV